MSEHFPTSIRYLNKGFNSSERTNFSNWWKEEIQMFGHEIDYYVNTYALTGADNTYGEHPTATFIDPIKMVIMIDLTENSLIYSKFGLMGDDEISGVIHIDAFKTSMSTLTAAGHTEPKAGDVFQLEEYGEDRPGDRNGKFFEITERLDEEISQINALMGHYVWLIKAKRYDHSFEPGVSGEKVSTQLTEDSFAGRLSGGENPQTDNKPYNTTADDDASDNFDNSNDDIYGGY
jgi:hypothetical protein